MPKTTRTFIAVELPDSVVERLSERRESLAATLPDVRWVPPAQLHLTLAFLGEVDDDRLARLTRALRQTAGTFDRFDLDLKGLGAFPDPRRPRVLWAGATGPGIERLTALQRAVADAAAAADCPLADDRFHPHVTLGRIRPGRGAPRGVASVLDTHERWSPGTIPVAAVTTFASRLFSDGPRYEALDRATLRTAASASVGSAAS